MIGEVAAFLERDGWSPQLDPDSGVIGAGFLGDSGSWMVLVRVLAAQERIIVFSRRADAVPPAARPAVAELFTRVNFDTLIGSFDLDLDDGEARFRTSVDLEGTGYADSLLRQILYANVTSFDRMLPAIDAVIGGSGVAAALGYIPPE